MKKRGLSEVVTTVLIILLAIAAVAAIGIFVLRMVQEGSQTLETAPTNIQLSILEQYVKYDQFGSPSYINLNVKRNSGEGNLVGLNIVLEDEDGKSYSQTREDIQIGEFESKPIIINSSQISKRIKKVEVSPIILSDSGKKFLGKTIASVSVSPSGTGTNLINPSTWIVGQSGSQTGFNQNGDISENIIELGTGPLGGIVPLWKGGNDAADNADGGWNTNSFSVDPTKTYRFSVWIKKTGSNNGVTYLGASGSITYFSNTEEGNPYFFYGDLPLLNKWYLVVGYIHPYTYNSNTHLGGIYDGDTKQKVVSFTGTSNGNTDFKFKSSSSTSNAHRTYLFYDTNIIDRQYFYGPRVDVIDGTEPSIDQLIGKA